MRLDDCHQKITALLAEIDSTNESYRIGQQALQALDSGEPVNMSGVGMNIIFGDATIPVPLPSDQESFAERVAEGVSFLGEELVRLWNELHATALVAKQHCDAARAQAQAAQQQGQQPPPAMETVPHAAQQPPPPAQPPAAPQAPTPVRVQEVPQQVGPQVVSGASPVQSVIRQPGPIRTTPVQ